MTASRVDPIKPWGQGRFRHPGSAFHLPGTFIVTGCFIVYHYFCLLLVVVVVVVVVVVLQYDDDDDDDDDDDVECCRGNILLAAFLHELYIRANRGSKHGCRTHPYTILSAVPTRRSEHTRGCLSRPCKP